MDSAGNTSEYRMRRIYSDPRPDDGMRVLVDRLWPRGIAESDKAFDEWLKSVAPSSQLRVWYGHREERYAEFVQRYRWELRDEARVRALESLRAWRKKGPVTLLTASRDVDTSHVPILVAVLTGSDSAG